MIYLKHYKQSDYVALNYQLDEIQSEFTATLSLCVDERQDLLDPNKTLVSIVEPEPETATATPIGFFVLDVGEDKFGVTDNDKAVLIRSFSLNPAYQGRGYGKLAMQLTAEFVHKALPNVNELVLSVNCRNIEAYQVYLKAGYADTGRTIMGIAGEQHVMSYRL